METEKKFKTKDGYCHILPDKIVFTRDGVIGNLASTVHGNHIYQSVIIYTALIAVLSWLLVKHYAKGDSFSVLFYCVIIVCLFYFIIRVFRYSVSPVIRRSSIRHIVYKKAIPFLTRTCFEVYFADEKDRIKKRLISLPTSLTNGEAMANEALEIMRSEQLITD
ncbi:MAG: phosphoribosylaminoimidazolesuccinocarboxamide synthase [Bacteroidota bacterium]